MDFKIGDKVVYTDIKKMPYPLRKDIAEEIELISHPLRDGIVFIKFKDIPWTYCLPLTKLRRA